MELLLKNKRTIIVIFSISAIAAIFFLLWDEDTPNFNHDFMFMASVTVCFISLSLFITCEAFKPIRDRSGRSSRVVAKILIIPVSIVAIYLIIAFFYVSIRL